MIRKQNWVRNLIYYAVAAGLGFGIHFLFDWSPNLLFAVLSPVSESVWEHSKLVIWPLLIVGLIYTHKDRKQRGSWYLGILAAWALILLYGGIVNIKMGIISMPVNIAAFLIILALGFLVAVTVDVPPSWNAMLLVAVGVLIALVMIFTFQVPKGAFFADLERADALYTLPC